MSYLTISGQIVPQAIFNRIRPNSHGLSFNQVSVSPMQSNLYFNDFRLHSSLSKMLERLLQFKDNVEKLLIESQCECMSEKVQGRLCKIVTCSQAVL